MPQEDRVDWVGEATGETTSHCTTCVEVWEDYWNDRFCSVIFVTGLARPNTGKDKANGSGSGNDNNDMMHSVVIDGNFYLLNSYSLYMLLQLFKNGFSF